MQYLFVCGLWAGYCALHSFLISTWFTKVISRRLKNYYSFYRLFYVILSFALLIPLINYSVQIDNKVIIFYSTPWSELRYVLMYGALLLFAWAFFVDYDSLSFFGIRQIMNFRKTSDISGAIKKKGLLGVVRHPMYLALIIFLWSSIFTLMDVLVNALLTIYVLIGTYLEERKLVLEFGNAYEQYKHEVPMLIPFIKPKDIQGHFAK